MSTHNLYFEQKYEKYQSFLFENFQFLEVKFSIYLNRHVFVMSGVLSVNIFICVQICKCFSYYRLKLADILKTKFS